MAETIRWGIIGVGSIARRFAASLEHVADAELVACAGRTTEHVMAFAAEHGCKAEPTPEALLADSDVDVVYLAVPHLQHAPWALAAIDAGKPVLAEKPAFVSCAQAIAVTDAAQQAGVLFVEAMKPRFQPLWQRILEHVDPDVLGELLEVDARLAMVYPEEPEGFFAEPVQGGVLLDLGTYAASWLDAFTTGNPEVVAVSHEWDHDVDVEDTADLRLGNARCHLEVSARREESVCTLAFEHATLRATPLHRPTELHVSFDDGREEEISVPYVGDDFTGEIEHVSALVREGATESPLMPHAATIRCARIIDACASGFDRLGVAMELGEICGRDAVFLNEPMADHTTFEIGGPADVFVEAPSVVKLSQALDALKREGVPSFVLGNGSDLLVSDWGIRGVVFSTARLKTMRVDANWIPKFGVARLYADCGVSLKDLAGAAAYAGLKGLEFASGIPGTVGGALFMNAGAYDHCMGDVVESAMVHFPSGEVKVLKNRELDFAYRSSRVREEGLTVLTATFLLVPEDPEVVRKRIDELTELRAAKQPLDMPSAGSTFKRPEGHYAGKLIADAGLKGTRVGGAEVSRKHAGFIVNAGEASAKDVSELIDLVTRKVEEESGVALEPEVQRIGPYLA